MTLTFIMGLKGAQLIVVALVVLLLFGSAKIPSIMRNIGKGIHGFKQGIEDAKAEINKEVTPRTDKDKNDSDPGANNA